MNTTLVADLIAAGVRFRPEEGIAIAQQLIHARTTPGAMTPPAVPLGPPSPENVHLHADGSVSCEGYQVTPAVFEMAIFLQTLLPPGALQVPGALRYAIARGLLDVDAPPYDSVGEFSRRTRAVRAGRAAGGRAGAAGSRAWAARNPWLWTSTRGASPGRSPPQRSGGGSTSPRASGGRSPVVRREPGTYRPVASRRREATLPAALRHCRSARGRSDARRCCRSPGPSDANARCFSAPGERVRRARRSRRAAGDACWPPGGAARSTGPPGSAASSGGEGPTRSIGPTGYIGQIRSVGPLRSAGPIRSAAGPGARPPAASRLFAGVRVERRRDVLPHRRDARCAQRAGDDADIVGRR